MTAYLLAVDSGSQSTKVSVVDEDGHVHAAASAPLRPYDLGPGGTAVHPDDDLWNTLVAAVRRVLSDFAGGPDDLVAVGLCGIRFCRALVDAEGRLTEPVQSWMDERVSRPLGRLDQDVTLVTSAGGYLTVRLTGERRDSSASYQGMWPVDPRTRRWSEDDAEVARTGLTREVLPDLVDPGGLLGHVTTAAAGSSGLRAGLPVFATGNDKAVEALGAGLLEPGTLLLSLGTYVAAMTAAPDAAVRDGVWTNTAAVPGRHLHESRGIRRGMWTVSWLEDLVTAGVPGPSDAGAVRRGLEEQAWQVPVGCGGLLTVPDWLPPGEAPHRRGAILGLDGSHRAPHLYRSALEGIALTMRGHAEPLLAGEDAPTSMVLTGGGSRSDLASQVVADVFGRRVERAAVPDAAGLGAAICAAVGHGTHRDAEAAVARMVHPGVVVEHDPGRHRRYEEIRSFYRTLPGYTDPLFEQLAGVRG